MQMTVEWIEEIPTRKRGNTSGRYLKTMRCIRCYPVKERRHIRFDVRYPMPVEKLASVPGHKNQTCEIWHHQQKRSVKCPSIGQKHFDPVEAVSSFLSNSGFNGGYSTLKRRYSRSPMASAVGARKEIPESILLRVQGEIFCAYSMSGSTGRYQKIKKYSELPCVLRKSRNAVMVRVGRRTSVGYPEQPGHYWTRSQLPEVSTQVRTSIFPISPAELLRIWRKSG